MSDAPSQSDTQPPQAGRQPDGPWGQGPRQPGAPRPRQPIFNAMPLAVLLLSAALIGVTAVQLLGPPDLENELLAAGALVGGPGYGDVSQPYGPLAPLVLHVFLHGGWLHLFMNMTAMAAFGPAVALSLGRGARGAALFLGFFFVCAIGGGLAQELAYRLEDSPGIAIGASSALSGLLPAAGWLQGGWKGAMRLSVFWLLINLAIAIGGFAIPLPIAWAAHLGGLAAGLALFPLFLALRADRAPRR